jgi:hypothetical protein
MGAETVGLETPRDLQLVEVGGVDLIERRVAGECQVGAVARPFAVAGRRLTLARELRRYRRPDEDLRRNRLYRPSSMPISRKYS